MTQKKICMLGSFAVGKTSLVQRFVTSTFNPTYSATVGVRIHKKEVVLPDRKLKLIIWDLAGEDELVRLRTAYLSGSSGYLLVVDGTRRETLDKALELQERVSHAVGPLPFLLLFNKMDRMVEWSMEPEAIESLRHNDWTWIKTSARTGEGVDFAFRTIAERVADVNAVGSTL